MDMEDAPFIKSITEDLNVRHKGRFMVITGPPGEGKSFTGARLCEIIDPSFTVDRIAIGKTTEFLKLLKKAVPIGSQPGELKSGCAIMLDEAGMGISAREWQSAQNRVLGLIFQVIRKLGLFVVLTVPSKAMIDITAQRLMSYYANAVAVDYTAKRSEFKIYKIRYDDWNDVILHYNLFDGHNRKVDVWRLALPKSLDVTEYERRKDSAISWLFNRAETVFTKLEDEGWGGNGHGDEPRFVPAKKTPSKMAEEMLCAGIDKKTISDSTNLAISTLSRIERDLVKSGIVIGGGG